MPLKPLFIFFIFLFCFYQQTAAQTTASKKQMVSLLPAADTVPPSKNEPVTVSDSLSLKKKDSSSIPVKDSTVRNKHIPRKATLRSLILPGWGQAYNKEYWKIPIVYGALAIPGSLYFYNNKWYKKTKLAYELKINGDSSRFNEIDPKIRNLSPGSLQSYRNQFRQNRDYSILYFIILWGVNVADATVFAHLKDFDVNDDLSLQIKPTFEANKPGISLVFSFKNTPRKIKLP